MPNILANGTIVPDIGSAYAANLLTNWTALDVNRIFSCTFATLGQTSVGGATTAAGSHVAGRLFLCTDTLGIYYDNGSSYVIVDNVNPRKNFTTNGNFNIFQRGTTAVTTSGAYGPADMWKTTVTGDTFSATQGSFVSGDALFDPTTGNIGATYYQQWAVTSVANANNYTIIQQNIENVRRLANQTVTLSFWAKAASGTPSIGVSIDQNFGSGGSAQVNGTGTAFTLSTAWTKFTLTATLGSVNGKTLGADNTSSTILYFWLDAGSNFNTRSGSIGQATKTVSIAQVQLEIGPAATPFEILPYKEELALCRRYYWREAPGGDHFYFSGWGSSYDANSCFFRMRFPVTMRIRPTAIEQSGTASDYKLDSAAGSGTNCTSVPTYSSATTAEQGIIIATSTGLFSGGGVPTALAAGASTTGYIGWSAEF